MRCTWRIDCLPRGSYVLLQQFLGHLLVPCQISKKSLSQISPTRPPYSRHRHLDRGEYHKNQMLMGALITRFHLSIYLEGDPQCSSNSLMPGLAPRPILSLPQSWIWTELFHHVKNHVCLCGTWLPKRVSSHLISNEKYHRGQCYGQSCQ
jgi:hypothetical protein